MTAQDRLRAARKSAGRTLADIASDTGLTVAYLSQLELGQRNGTIETWTKLASSLGVPPAALVFGVCDPRGTEE
jgi:transcriptional regulator with XRE-family HTH domain